MATVYKFILEQRNVGGGGDYSVDADGVVVPRKGAGNKGGGGRIMTGSNRGVEHNRYGRLLNPVINRYTGGWWEKGMRMQRSVIGVVETTKTSGFGKALLSVGMIQIAQLGIMELVKYIEREKKKSNQSNQADYLRLRSGTTMIGKDYKITKNFFGKITYKSQ